MSDVFISYARSTAKQAQAVAEALRALGYGVWRDDELPAHRDYAEVIEERLQSAKAVVVIWSAEAAKSEWVQSEADTARTDRKLVQLTVDGSRLPRPFDRIQCADLAGWTGDTDAPGWRKVVASIVDLVGAVGSASPTRPTDLPAAAKPAEPLLAVLAFDNLSGDPDMAYFSDGVSEEIQQTVARGTDLKVIGRSSSFQFRGADKAARNIAAQLKATHILDGSVRRSGPRVRISAQLEDCASQTTLWSDRFDRDLSDIFALQDEIAGAVAAALKAAFAPPTPADFVDPAIYDLFLRARARPSIDPETSVQTIKMLERVVVAAPKLARAWATLAMYRCSLLRTHPEAARQHGTSRESALDAAETALNLDAGLGLAYVALSYLEAWASFEKREALLRKALDLGPNDPANLTAMAEFSSQVGRNRERAEYIKQAYDLDPLDVGVAFNYACRPGSYDRYLWQSLRLRWPDNDLIAFGAIVHATLNEDWEGYDSFVAASRALIANNPTFQGLIWYAGNLRNPNSEAARNWFEVTRQDLSRTGTVPLINLTSLSSLGMAEEVFGLIDQASFAHAFDERRHRQREQAATRVRFSGLIGTWP